MQLLCLLVLALVLSLGSIKSIALLSKSLWGVVLLSQGGPFQLVYPMEISGRHSMYSLDEGLTLG